VDLHRAIYFRTYTRYDTLVAGILLAFVHQEWSEPVTRWLKDPFHRALLLVPSLGCLWLLMRPLLFGKQGEQLMHVLSWGTLTTLMYFAWLLLLLYSDGWLQRTLAHPVFRKVATLGYGVYLVHIPVLNRVLVPLAWGLQKRHVPMAVIWPVSLVLLMALSLAVAYVLHLLIEKPSMWVRQKFAA
jgi:peptidoglycan/LPS O-acetylase OafA/YrhL